jgi:hypothetical protein
MVLAYPLQTPMRTDRPTDLLKPIVAPTRPIIGSEIRLDHADALLLPGGSDGRLFALGRSQVDIAFSEYALDLV